MPNEKPHFRARTRLLAQLGEQLIKNQSIALQELIKNSYDADASFCLVIMENLESSDEGKITILDDGSGMDFQTLSEVWLEVGTSQKNDLKKSGVKRTHRFNRIPLGEKGIGRLGVHRLGSEIEIVSRMENARECRLFINWDDIEQSRYIEDFPVILEEREPEYFRNTTGTQITIRRLKGEWTRSTVRECARAIMSLDSPFEDNSSFRAELQLPGSNWLDGLLSFEDIEKYKLFEFEARMEGVYIMDFKYSFLPYPTMKKLGPRQLGNDFIKPLARMVREENNEQKPIDLSTEEIGPVVFKGILFDLDPRILNIADLNDKRSFRNYLAVNGGVRIFRENMRVWDYGEPENDWLELETRRVNQPSFRISKRLILGAVYLDSEKSRGLIEKTNREGFMDNKAYQLLKSACIYVLEKVELARRPDKELLRKFYGPSSKDEPLITSLEEAKDIIGKHVHDEKALKEINRYLDRIQEDYEKITNNLIKSAGAGLNLVIVIHQMQKLLKNIQAGLKKNMPIQQIEEQVRELVQLVEGYSILVKNSEIKLRNLKGILEEIMFNLDFRFRSHAVSLNAAFRTRTENLDGICSKSHVMNAVMNLVDNSIWWMDYAQTRDKSIFIDITPEFEGYTTILVADNGPGFAIPTELLGKPFVTAKPEGAGMGIGLHLCTQIMESLGGKILYPAWGDFYIPDEYKTGAIVALAFRKEKNNASFQSKNIDSR